MDTTIADKVKAFVLEEFLPGEDPDELTDSTELVSSNILDSLAILKLVTFLEEEFKIEIAAHEADEEHMNTLADIAVLVNSKLG
ncbi:MAG: acyl carrier protein [Myxococcota bacterium]